MTTHLERFVIYDTDDKAHSSIHYENDGDLAIHFSRGEVFKGESLTECTGLVAVALEVDGEPQAVVKVDRVGPPDRAVDVLNATIGHLEVVRDELRRLGN